MGIFHKVLFIYYSSYNLDAKIDDSLKSSHPISVNVTNPEQIHEIFDMIVYNKGACVIRMLSDYLGEDSWRKVFTFILGIKFIFKQV